MQSTRMLSLMLLAALAAPAAGCVVVADDPRPLRDTGTLTIAYTIEGTTDPFLCSYYGATDAELVVYTPGGDLVAEEYAPCDWFEVSTTLLPGRYTADVTLVDAANRARSITKPLDALDVFSDAELVVDVGFPAGSML